MRKTTLHSLIIAIAGACILSCSGPANQSNQSTATYDIGLVEEKKIILPVDEKTYYMSRTIFPFEKEGREFLCFGNIEKSQYEIIIYDLENHNVYKRIPLERQGPDGVPAVRGIKYSEEIDKFILTQNSFSRITLLEENGTVSHKYSIKSSESPFIGFTISSYFHVPSFLKDSVLYLASEALKPNIKKEEWQATPLFFSLDLRTTEIDFLPMCYPPVFNKDVKNLSVGSQFSYDYNHYQDRLVCSFITYDSIMVSDDLRTVKWHDGKSRYLRPNLSPQLMESSEGIEGFAEVKRSGHYYHMMYDKYRDVYYRFVEHPCDATPEEILSDGPKSREFSVIIFDKDFRIIGETKFPGNKYFNKMSFVGRDGLYISENNLANPDFDEDKLVFACFKLEDLKGK